MGSAQQTPERPIININGEKVALGPLRRDLVPLYHRWANDFEGMVTVTWLRPRTLESEQVDYEQASKSDDPSIVHFTIYERATMRPIGTANLHNIKPFHRRAEFGIGIGEKDCWGKGYGTEATRLVLDYGFTLLGLHTIMLWVLGFNEQAIRCYRRAGFRENGRWHEAYRLGGTAHDIVFMECLAREFENSALHRLLPLDGSPAS